MQNPTSCPFTLAFSSRSKFLTCPRQFEGSYITRVIKFTPSTHTHLGNAVHKIAEWASREKGARLNPDRITDEDIRRALRSVDAPMDMLDTVRAHWTTLFTKRKAFVGIAEDTFGEGNVVLASEMEVAAEKDRTTGAYRTCNYYSKTGLTRSKIDLVALSRDPAFPIALIADYKTGGSVRETTQLEESAAALFLQTPALQSIIAVYMHTQHDDPAPYVFTRDHLPEMLAKIQKVNLLIDDAYAMNEFPPKKSGLCRSFCDHPTCEFNGKLIGG